MISVKVKNEMKKRENEIVLKQEEYCCACSACVHVCPVKAIEMRYDKKGFQIPIIDAEKCIECGLCQNVCAFHKKNIYKNQINEVYAFQKKKGRKEVQSGGAFCAMAEIFLENGGVVYGVSLDSDDMCARYSRVDSIEAVSGIIGSKYIQAENGNVMNEIADDLCKNVVVLVSGTPCFIDGLKSYLKVKDVSTRTLYTCDIICHGVPSLLLFHNYIAYLRSRFGAISNFNFRDKSVSGWHGHIETFCVEKGGKLKSGNFVNIFYSHLCLRESCYKCYYSSTNRVSDITIGDFWGIEEMDWEIDDNRGTSILLGNTSKGNCIIEVLKKMGKVRGYRINYAQPNLRHPTHKPDNYDSFWNLYFEKGFMNAVKKLCNFNEYDYRKYGKCLATINYKRRYIVFLLKNFKRRWKRIKRKEKNE